jgi:hypothetical protein
VRPQVAASKLCVVLNDGCRREQGQTVGLLHPDGLDAVLAELQHLFLGGSCQCLDGSNPANKNNAMWSGVHPNMNDVTATDININQLEILIKNEKSGKLNKNKVGKMR